MSDPKVIRIKNTPPPPPTLIPKRRNDSASDTIRIELSASDAELLETLFVSIGGSPTSQRETPSSFMPLTISGFYNTRPDVSRRTRDLLNTLHERLEAARVFSLGRFPV